MTTSSSAELELIKVLMSGKLTPDSVKVIARNIVVLASQQLPGKSGTEKKQWAIDRMLKVMEMFDNQVPVLGTFMDFPVVDGMEKWAVSMAVEWAWGYLTAKGILK